MTALSNFSDPLSIHASDIPGMNLINEQLIGVENYGVWSRAMLIVLRAKNKLAFVDGTSKRPASGSLTLNQWERCNALVLSWIMNSVSKDIFGAIVYASDASIVWADLKEQYDTVNGSRIFSIHREIGRLSQGNNTISTYYCKLKQLWDEYGSLVTLPPCECAAARKYVELDQQQKLLQFLMVGRAFNLLYQEESHRSMSSIETPTSVFYSVQNPNDGMKQDEVRCDYCNWVGHTKANCYKLVGYPPGHRLYKQQRSKGFNKKGNKDLYKTKKGQPAVNMANEDNGEVQPVNSAPGPLFTPAQYAENLKLLSGNALQSANDPVVNMTGPREWEDHGDW